MFRSRDISVPLVRALCFNIFENLNLISLYWFAAQQQTNAFRRQKVGLFYPEFSAEFNELSLNV